MKITKITPEQAARFGEWAQRWIEIGLSTEPADFDKATAAALRDYDLANLRRPMVILHMSSPYGAMVGGVIAWWMLRELFGKKVWSQVRSQVWSQVWSQVESQVRSQVRSQIYRNSYQGAFWASWGAYVSFFRDVMGWNDPILKRFEIDEALIKSCGWVWWHENVLAISDRPEFIRRDEQNRLHCETGPAIRYRDGWSLYSWHGTTIAEEWITNPKTLTPVKALKESNIERRRAACEILGWSKILDVLEAKVVDSDPDPEIGTLVSVKLPDLSEEAKFLRVRCATGREFAIGIPPHINKALDAQAWMVGLEPKDFIRPETRT